MNSYWFLSCMIIIFPLQFQSSQSSGSGLVWHNITQPFVRGALCNDFTGAGYFIRKVNSEVLSGSGEYRKPEVGESNPSRNKEPWLIFLEGGGGCTTPVSCNERFIEQSIRMQYRDLRDDGFVVDVEKAWNEHRSDPLKVTSKLMTSIWRFSHLEKNGSNYYVSDSGPVWEIEGRDLLSTSSEDNPDFYYYNHVLIPYCSSDVWLKNTNNYRKALFENFTFQFQPNATEDFQFTFRGETIFKSVIEDLYSYHELGNADEVLLAGSSAGGVGALNHAAWLNNNLAKHGGGKLRVLIDSAWFINFKGEILKQFAPSILKKLIRSGEISESCMPFNKNYEFVEGRQDEESSAIVACVSAHLFLLRNRFPKNVPLFTVFSRYDLYLLSRSIAAVTFSEGNFDEGFINVLELVRVVEEYSGAMNGSLRSFTPSIISINKCCLSYYVTSCFQHVYLATSTLWGENSFFGSASEDGTIDNYRFRHTVRSDVWNKFHLQHCTKNPCNKSNIQPLTLSSAVHQWMETTRQNPTNVMQFQDACQGAYCNSECPEEIVLGELYPYWSDWSDSHQIGVIVLVLGISVISTILIFCVYIRNCVIRICNARYVRNIQPSQAFGLPYCEDSRAISISCVDLSYEVEVRKSEMMKMMTSTVQNYNRMVSVDVSESSRGREKAKNLSEIPLDYSNKILDSDISTIAHESQNYSKGKENNKKFIHSVFTKFQNLWEKVTFGKSNKNKKKILQGISMYCNPGDLVAVMGPSGCGKTTFLNLIAGRSGGEMYKGKIFVNGVSMNELHDWYISNTGYMLQLATPYYNELSVQENLTLAAQMRLPSTFSSCEKFKRVQEVMNVTGLTKHASLIVGGSTGRGLSGGQKRCLCVAIQLLTMPSLLFLDEPTSGLDAASSVELLQHLNRVASSNRAVMLTIHQPRLEIFHMFHKILLLCQGRVAYYGSPMKVYEFFMESCRVAGLSLSIKELQDKNPADAVLDMFENEGSRSAVLNYYQQSNEPTSIRNAILQSSKKKKKISKQQESVWETNDPGSINRICALEARATQRITIYQLLYIPLSFFIFGLVLGSVYYQVNDMTFLLSPFGVLSCASGLFMFPAVYSYLYDAIQMHAFETSDGVGNSFELVLQTFLRFKTLVFLPSVLCSIITYVMVIPVPLYNGWIIFQVVTFNLAINQTWIAMVTLLIMLIPGRAHRVSPIISGIAGFTEGFFIPKPTMPFWYQWVFYINPNFYGFSATIRVLIQNVTLGCVFDSPIECYPNSGRYILTHLGLHQTNPYLHIIYLVGMTFFFLFFAWMVLVIRSLNIVPYIKKYWHILRNNYDNVDVKNAIIEEKSSSDEGCNTNSQWQSSTLEDGEYHYVWKPGDRQTEVKATLEHRQKALLMRIDTCRGSFQYGQDDQVSQIPGTDVGSTNVKQGDPKKIPKKKRRISKIMKEAMETPQYYKSGSTSQRDDESYNTSNRITVIAEIEKEAIKVTPFQQI